LTENAKKGPRRIEDWRRTEEPAAAESALSLAPRTELRVLRHAVARGFVAWDDLEAIADRVSRRSADGRPATGSWLHALIEAGRLSPELVSELAAAVSGTIEPAAEPAPKAPPTLDLGRPASRPSRPLLDGLDGSLADWERYQMVSYLGAGGMGTVYKAFDPSLMRFVALKFLHRNDTEEAERFLREARVQARIDHPHVGQVFEVGEAPGSRPYIAMQLIAGDTLDVALADQPPETVARVMRDVALAVHAGHRLGLIHRDLKPGNILVSRRATGSLHPYVVDFGLAHDLEDPTVAKSRSLVGTPAYLAPEQARGATPDRRTDVYSLGVVLYELLSGHPPFSGNTVAETLVAILEQAPQRLEQRVPHLSRDLAAIAAKCLEKNPADRYDSARALAEDLGRFLDGLPVEARHLGRGARLLRWAQKNRRMVAVATVAALALGGSAGLNLRTRAEAQKRAELAQQFGQRVRQLVADLRFESLLPLHDTTSFRRDVRQRMTTIEQEMVRLSPLADGPGHHALGMAYWALQEAAPAAEHLERAWRAGQRTPEVATSLALALGHLSSRALLETDRPLPSDAARKALADELAELYRKPALAYLRESSERLGASAAPELHALLALYEGRFSEALELVRSSVITTPWLYQGSLIEAEALLAQADQALEAGRRGEGVALLEAAGAVYSRVLSIARSDAAVHAAECGRRFKLLQVQIAADEPAAVATRNDALAQCDVALVASPDLAEAHSKKAGIHTRWAEAMSRRGEDPEPEIDRAIAAARAAIAIEPEEPNAYGHLTLAHRLRARWKLARGLPADGDLDLAIATAEQAVTLAQSTSQGFNLLGNAVLTRAGATQARGLDPRPDLVRAAAAYDRSIELFDRNAGAHTNLGNVWKMRAEYELGRGVDPTPALERAVQSFRRAVALTPDSAPFHNNLGNAHLTRGEFLETTGGDGGPAFDEAIEHYRAAIERRPGYAIAHWNLADAERRRAARDLRRGDDPEPAVARGFAALAEAERLNPSDPDNALERARLEQLVARGRPGAEGLAALDRADRVLVALRRGQPDHPSAAILAGELALDRAARTTGRERSAALAAGFAAAVRALELAPDSLDALVLRGLLTAQRRELATAAADRADLARQAAADLRRALDTNPFLASRLSAPLAALVEAGESSG
jgi:eukaryotic-like serine/threonine-protein kinase